MEWYYIILLIVFITLVLGFVILSVSVKKELRDLEARQKEIITRLPNRIAIEEGVGSKTYWSEMIGFRPYPVTKSETIFKPTKTNIYDLIDFKNELYDNIVKLQRVQPKDLKENHRYYRVTHVSMLEEITEYFYIGEPIMETKEVKQKTPRTKKEPISNLDKIENKLEKGE